MRSKAFGVTPASVRQDIGEQCGTRLKLKGDHRQRWMIALDASTGAIVWSQPAPTGTSYISPQQRIPRDPPLRQIRVMTDEALREFVRSEQILMEQLDYGLLFRWFVGLNTDDPIWDVTVFTKDRERLLAGDIA